VETSVLIRPAFPDDAPAIHAMVVELARDTGKLDLITSTSDDIRRHGFGDAPAFGTLIALRDGKPVGLAVYFGEFSTWRGRRGVYLQDLYVVPDMRGSGLGRRLVKAVVERTAAEGASYMRLAVDADNDAAAKFYERIGFAEIVEDRLFMLIGDAFEKLKRE
jgi:ribosomal protein S18 acetylase RimI-like enzyme